MLAPVTTFAAPVSEENQPSSWAMERVNAAIAAQLVPEVLQTQYLEPITRAEFCALAVRFIETVSNADIGGRIRFSDTEDPNVEMAAWMGLVQGIEDGLFDPNGLLTREYIATILVRLSMVVDHPLPRAIATFTDNAEVAGWAFASVGRVHEAGIMYGIDDLRFGPGGIYSREQSIVSIVTLYEFVTANPVPTPSFDLSSRSYDMSDPNVQKHPELTTSTLSGLPGNWRSADEVKATSKRDVPEGQVNGEMFYERCMRPIETWVDIYVSAHNLSVTGMTDYEKSEVVKAIVSDEPALGELIRIWEPGFRFSEGDCVQRARAVQFLMAALDFERFHIVVVQFRPDLTHATNAYWDASSGAIRFIDAPGNKWGVWNLFLDELDENSGAILI